MKIGTLTFHHTTNYGATLQAYALSQVLAAQGHDVEVVDYRPYKAAKNYRKELKPIDKRFKVKPAAFNYWLKYLKMRRFLLSEMRLSQEKTYRLEGLYNILRKYNAVICGSDQIWCLDSPFRGFNPAFFLSFPRPAKNFKKISYAASFGSTVALGNKKGEVVRAIQDFDCVSVRDANSLRIVREDCEREAVKVLDPTFLLGRERYEQMMVGPEHQNNYLLVYNQGTLSLAEQNFIEGIARERDLEIVSVGLYNDFAHKNVTTAGPREWLGYFFDAAHVVTNTYHGTIFSLIFHKPFNVLTYKGKSLKTMDLLASLSLENRVADCNSASSEDRDYGDRDCIGSAIDYPQVQQKIDERIAVSLNFLRQSTSPSEISSDLAVGSRA